MPVSDPFFHVLFLGRRAALDCPPYDPFPPTGRKTWKADPVPRRDLCSTFRHYKWSSSRSAAQGASGRAALTIEAVGDGLGEAALGLPPKCGSPR